MMLSVGGFAVDNGDNNTEKKKKTENRKKNLWWKNLPLIDIFI